MWVKTYTSRIQTSSRHIAQALRLGTSKPRWVAQLLDLPHPQKDKAASPKFRKKDKAASPEFRKHKSSKPRGEGSEEGEDLAMSPLKAIGCKTACVLVLKREPLFFTFTISGRRFLPWEIAFL